MQDVIIDPELFIREIMRNAQINKRSAREYLEEAKLTLREPVNAGNDERTGNAL